jgi:miniconductance mechanosensitive channel
MIEYLVEWLTGIGATEQIADLAARAIVVLGIVVLSYLANVLTKRVLLRVVTAAIRKTGTKWDDQLLEKRLFNRAAHLAPAIVISLLADIPFEGFDTAVAAVHAAANIYMLVVVGLVVESLINRLRGI